MRPSSASSETARVPLTPELAATLRARRPTRRREVSASPCATLSHMEVGVRDLRNRTGQVIDAVKAGERVTLTVHGEPVADIVPHGRRTRCLAGARLRKQLRDRAADPGLQRELDE